MSSSYPGALDSLANPSGGDAMNGANLHSAQHANANDAIEAVQSTLGIDPQGSEATVADRLDAIESSVGGGGGLILVASGTFSGSSTPHFDNVFDNTYRVHKLIVRLTSSAANFLRLRLRASGTDNTTSASYVSNGVGFTPSEDKMLAGVARTDYAIITYDIIDVAAAAKTYFNGTSIWGVGGATGGNSVHGCMHTQTVAYDGFTLYDDSSGTLAGDYWVYGYPT